MCNGAPRRLFFRPNAIGSSGKGDPFLKVYRLGIYGCIFVYIFL